MGPKDLQAKIQDLKAQMKSASRTQKKQLRQQIDELSFLKAQILSNPSPQPPDLPLNIKAKSRGRRKASEKIPSEVPLTWHPDALEEEDIKFENILSLIGLEIEEMPADGHCLFSAISHQLHVRHAKVLF